jgi:hypothetical protein
VSERDEGTAAVENAEFLGEATRGHLKWENGELVVRTEDPLSGTSRWGSTPRTPT